MADQTKPTGADHGDGGDTPRDGERREGQQKKQQQDGGWLETLAAWISGLLILAVAAVLVWQEVRTKEPPSFEVRSGDVRKAGEEYHVTLHLRNNGDEAAQQVEIEARLLREGAEPSEAKVTIDWAPGQSSRKGTVVFAEDPRQGELELRVVGYAEP